ncbi:hypothetical protein [Amycolatopsis sp. CA-230715]|uniref:hypothetical protein n=1 Tax=Amycolatopsis sp. CA-230715 TaxID=2745196 RepID=UPI001C009D23|nr:hypothetical protein [Amycolatopsis sp. CA-230715]
MATWWKKAAGVAAKSCAALLAVLAAVAGQEHLGWLAVFAVCAALMTASGELCTAQIRSSSTEAASKKPAARAAQC